MYRNILRNVIQVIGHRPKSFEIPPSETSSRKPATNAKEELAGVDNLKFVVPPSAACFQEPAKNAEQQLAGVKSLLTNDYEKQPEYSQSLIPKDICSNGKQVFPNYEQLSFPFHDKRNGMNVLKNCARVGLEMHNEFMKAISNNSSLQFVTMHGTRPTESLQFLPVGLHLDMLITQSERCWKVIQNEESYSVHASSEMVGEAFKLLKAIESAVMVYNVVYECPTVSPQEHLTVEVNPMFRTTVYENARKVAIAAEEMGLKYNYDSMGAWRSEAHAIFEPIISDSRTPLDTEPKKIDMPNWRITLDDQIVEHQPWKDFNNRLDGCKNMFRQLCRDPKGRRLFDFDAEVSEYPWCIDTPSDDSAYREVACPKDFSAKAVSTWSATGQPQVHGLSVVTYTPVNLLALPYASEADSANLQLSIVLPKLSFCTTLAHALVPSFRPFYIYLPFSLCIFIA
eukprot:GHVT01016611.1.p1 GENE.GHVT01016611.1~~GHVT01016611.1.p1  ORF type:complete len:454 (-),score=34.42 GHVT01016611.1:1404-2765(-)